VRQLSEHFDSAEFICKCGCGMDTVDAELIAVLERTRLHFGAPVNITVHGGCRCEVLNKSIGGMPKSQHLVSKAADHWVTGVTHDELQNYYLRLYTDQYGIGCYPTFTHIDVRPWKARW
jgi:uncharacterized protein YcbK (DUF882 family)